MALSSCYKVELSGIITVFTVHESVLVVELVCWHRQSAGEEAKQKSSWDCDTPSHKNTSYLVTSLCSETSFRVLAELSRDMQIVLKIVLVHSDTNNSDDRSQSAGNTVKELHTAGIVQI